MTALGKAHYFCLSSHLYQIRAALQRKSGFTTKSGKASKSTNSHSINHGRKAIPKHTCSRCSEHLPQGSICAWLPQVQKLWSCHHGALLTSLHKEGGHTISHSLVSCTSSSVSSCKAVILGRGLRLLEFLWCIGSSLRRSAWLMACLKELFSFSSF